MPLIIPGVKETAASVYAGIGTPAAAIRFPEVHGLDGAADHIRNDNPQYFHMGVNGEGEPINIDLSETPHVILNGGTGGGKSVMARAAVSQILHAGGVATVLDYKRFSHRWAYDLPRVAYAKTLPDIGDALVSVGHELHRRTAIIEKYGEDAFDNPKFEMPTLVVLAEEMNATFSQIKELDKKVPAGQYGAIDAYRDILFLGRACRVHMIATAQLATRQALGGQEAVDNFGVKAMVNYSLSAWRWLVPDAGRYQPAPPQRGRGFLVSHNVAKETQFLFMTDEDARGLATSYIG